MSFFKVISEVHPRGLGYAILSLIIENTDIVYLIVDTEEEKEVLGEILLELKEQFEARRSFSSSLKLRDFKVLTADEYYSNWEEYAGKRLIFVKLDRNLKSPPLDKLALFIESMWRVRSRDPIRRIALHMVDLLLALDVAKEHYKYLRELMASEAKEEDPKKKKDLLKAIDRKRKELISMLEKRFSRREDIDLTYEIISFLVDKKIIE